MWETLVLTTFAGLLTILGIFLIKVGRRHALRYSHYVNSFAAGLILAAALAALLPQAVEGLKEQVGVYVLAGFAAFLVMETLLVFHSGAEVHYDPHSARVARGAVYFSGLLLHSLLDGVVIALGFAASQRIGIVMSLAVVTHELPEGITTFSLLLDKVSERTAMLLALAVALATPAGGVLGLALRPVLSTDLMAGVVAVVAGSFLYIAATDIIPEIREQQPVRNTAFMVAGIVFLMIAEHFLGH